MEQLGSHWMDFNEIWYLSVFRKSVEKFRVSLNSDNNNGYFTWRLIYIYDNISYISSCIDKYFRQKLWIKSKHILCSVNFFFENLSFKQIMRKNIAEPARPLIKVWRMRISCWLPKATNTHSEYVILNVFPLQQWLHERALLLPVLWPRSSVFIARYDLRFYPCNSSYLVLKVFNVCGSGDAAPCIPHSGAGWRLWCHALV